MKTSLLCLALPLLFAARVNADVYVAPNGDDANPGTLEKPFVRFTKAISVIKEGETIFVRGGTHIMKGAVLLDKSGTPDKKISLVAYKNEKPLLNFGPSEIRTRGFTITGNYWFIKGFEITGANGGVNITGGSFNTVEACVFHDNTETGLQMGNGASNNRVINCDSYHNADPQANYANADGFAPKLTLGTGNYFYGCRAWGNCDDGWDGYMRGANDITTTLENCWTWGNGWLKDGTDPGGQANGNGFKMGGGDGSNSLQLMHHFVLKNCLAFGNKNKGFDQNNNVGSMTMLNCTGFKNGAGNYVIVKPLVAGQKLIVKNSVSFDGAVRLGEYAIQQNNSWMLEGEITARDFLSIDPASAMAPRKPDGSLPDLKFMHIAPGSKLIRAGANVGLPFTGPAPDLGAFPFGSEVSK